MNGELRFSVLKKKSYYALGVTLAILGVIVLLVVLWRWWDIGVFSDTNIPSALISSFGEPDQILGLGIGLTLLPYTLICISCNRFRHLSLWKRKSHSHRRSNRPAWVSPLQASMERIHVANIPKINRLPNSANPIQTQMSQMHQIHPTKNSNNQNRIAIIDQSFLTLLQAAKSTQY